MKLGITNRINVLPIIINVFWSILILFQFIIRVPEFEKQRPDGASHLIFGIIILTGFIFLGSLIYILIANLYMKAKIYSDLIYAFIPLIFLLLIILFFR